MTGLLELREKIKMIYSKYEAIILPVVKFLLAFVVLNTINGRMGYMTQLDNVAVVLIVSLLYSFLPAGSIVVFAALFTLLHMYALSLEVMLVGFCLYLVLYLLVFRFAPKDSLVVVLMPLLFAWRIPYVIPIAVGLLCGPASVVSVGSGVLVHYLLNTVTSGASAISIMGEDDVTAKIRMIIDGMIGNKNMIVVIAAFAITVMVVYFIRRMSIDYAWTIAMVAGVMTNIVILLVGDLIYDINISVLEALLGSLLAVVVGKVIEFFRFCVDYGRTERVQFEDDEYYYYVKAVPKMSVSVSTKTVKRINTQRVSAPVEDYDDESVGRTGGSYEYRRRYGNYGGGERSVTTERTAYGRGGYNAQGRPIGRGGGRSVTIGSASANSVVDETEDYEEI